MNKKIAVFLTTSMIVLLYGCAGTRVVTPPPAPVQPNYSVSLRIDPVKGEFFVQQQFLSLSPANHTLYFLPGGAWKGVNFADLVSEIHAYDARGNRSPIRQIALNRWRLAHPSEVVKIEYRIRDVQHLPAAQRPPEMLGTLLKPRYAYLNWGGVVGVLSGLADQAFELTVQLPQHWQAVMALPQPQPLQFIAANYKVLLDSPLLAGEITTLTERIAGTTITLAVVAPDWQITAEHMYAPVRDIVEALNDFLNYGLPVENYTMLFVFDDVFAGGVAYPKSCAFVFQNAPLEQSLPDIRDVVAHELFHLVIPYALRSDALNIEALGQRRPTQHMWFFEGVTEWAANIIQLRAGLKTLSQFINEDFRQKLLYENWFGASASLQEMSLQSAGDPRDYANVYSRGALVATLLDIALLDDSHGRRGLREVINDLLLDYGPQKPLPEAQFFEILIDYCGPDMREFIEKYILQNEPLPIGEVLEKVGIRYYPVWEVQPPQPDFGFITGAWDGGVHLLPLEPAIEKCGIRKNDLLRRIEGYEVRPDNYREVLYQQVLPRLEIGHPYTVILERNGKPLRITCQTVSRKDYHLFESVRMLTPAQAIVRKAWLNRQ